MTTETLHPTITRAGEGEARWFMGSLVETMLTHAATGGALSILQVTEPPNSEAPLHVHHHDDETFVVLEGTVTFEVGGERIPAAAGDVAFGPRGVPHRFTAGPEGCRMLFVVTPGGRFDEMIREMSEPAGSRTLPPPPEGPPDVARMAAVAKAHGCELLV
jgi:quercetin dioxygenase-like cupin family protein